MGREEQGPKLFQNGLREQGKEIDWGFLYCSYGRGVGGGFPSVGRGSQGLKLPLVSKEGA